MEKSTDNPEAASPAATLLLLRDQPAFEVLMISRHENSAFAGGALVFPGGRVDRGDAPSFWYGFASGLSSDRFFGAAQIAAIRETFEEAGVLLARESGGALISAQRLRSLNEWRQSIEKGELSFLDFIRREELILACDLLHLFSHWIAPPGLHRRFDTLFFAAPFPEGQEVLDDSDEATEALWVAPDEALSARASGKRKIIFPTACNLGLLALSQNFHDVVEHAQRRPIRAVTPVPFKRDGKVFLKIPDDLGYPVTEEALEIARPDLS